ncbi:MAG: exosortase H [Bryobacteraceae bacterium]|jgi:exosortase H (IPTLxxWG-CTERM-specific)
MRTFLSTSRKPAPASRVRRKAARPALFAVLFGLFFLAGIGLVLLPPVQFLDGHFSRILVSVSRGLIAICGGAAKAEGAILRAPGGFAVEMKDGCNGVNVTILLWSAVLAFPAPWRLKALGLLAGSLAIQILNVVRFISLFYIGQYSTNWFEFAHGYLWETLLILDTMVVFWLWVSRVSRTGTAPNARG